MMQQTIVIIILILAVGYAAWRIYRSFRGDSEPCCGCEECPLKGPNCSEKCGENYKNADCCHKK
jgi:hypothetical protein